MSSVPAQIQYSGWKFPFRTAGLALVGVALFGFVYAFYPEDTKVANIDLGAKLSSELPGVATEEHPHKHQNEFLINASWFQRPPPATCAIEGVPKSLPEGSRRLEVTYSCKGSRINPVRYGAKWSPSDRVNFSNPSAIIVSTKGLAGQRLVLTASLTACGNCQETFEISVAEEKLRMAVNVTDDNGKAFPGALVTIAGREERTRPNGRAIFTDLKPGKYSVSVAAEGFNNFTTTHELTPRTASVDAKLVRVQTASPSPTVSPSPSPSSSEGPSPSPSTNVSPSPAPSASVSQSETVFAPGKNGSLSISWPTTVARGWSKVCRIRYVPPAVSPGNYNLEALFFLTSMVGFTNDTIWVPFQPLDQNAHEWEIPLEPDGPDGSVLSAQIVMQVKTGPQSSREIQLQAFQSTIENETLTKNQTVGGSALSGVLGVGLLGIGTKKKKPAPAPQKEPTGPSGDVQTKGISGEVETITPAESPRYVDVTIYEDHLFPEDDLKEALKVPDDVPLVANELYTLEVAIRLERTGIQAELPPKHEVDNPREGEETLTIHVVATPLRGFKITERLATIAWAFDADSESALFQLEIDPSTDTTRPGSIEIRILDHSLNLLDIVTMDVAIVTEEGAEVDAAVPLRRLIWPDNTREGLTLAGHSKPRLASIHVRQVTGGFTFQFVLLSARGEAVNISIFRDVSADDLTFLLARVRDFWTKLVITNYAKKLAVSTSTYDSYLRDLRDLGIQAWSLLFDTRTFAKEGASERLGQILARVEADEKALKEAQSLFDSGEGDRIQISYAADFGEFIFPWSILHPPVPNDTPVDPLRFWGARYQIEQVTKGPKKDRIDDRPINVLFALDSSFGDAPSQKKMFEDYQTAAKGELVVSTPISDRKSLAEYLIRDPSAHLLYFYCHGYAATRPGVLTADGVKSMKAMIEGVRAEATEGSPPLAAALEKLTELTSKMGGESWIYLGDSEVKEAELRLLRFFARRRPIVFLNMCQSADLVPSMSSGLVHLFLDHNASAVVGTESPMTGVFADAFAKKVLDRLFAGDNIGTSLWNARRHFLTQERNPLGLAYTLYGRADANLGNQSRPFVIPKSTDYTE